MMAVAALAFAMPAQAGVNDPEVVIYRGAGVLDTGGGDNTGAGTAIHCTNFSGVNENIRFVIRNTNAALQHGHGIDQSRVSLQWDQSEHRPDQTRHGGRRGNVDPCHLYGLTVRSWRRWRRESANRQAAHDAVQPDSGHAGIARQQTSESRCGRLYRGRAAVPRTRHPTRRSAPRAPERAALSPQHPRLRRLGPQRRRVRQSVAQHPRVRRPVPQRPRLQRPVTLLGATQP
jgi:hypothetical protein